MNAGAAPWIALLGLSACGSAPPRSVAPPTPAASFTPSAVIARELGTDPASGALVSDPLGLPAADDAELARVGDESITKSQVFDRLAATDPALAQTVIDTCVLDRVVAQAVARFGIAVTPAEIEARAAIEEATLRLQDGNPIDDAAFARVVEDRFGAGIAEYRAALRREVQRVLLRSCTIRFLALREDQVDVRILVHHDRALLAELADRVRQGADFASLARRNSEDRTASDGGALPSLPRSARHPIARAAFVLEEGECSAPIAIDDHGRFALVWCVAHRAGRDLSFETVREEIVAALDTRPITPFEQNAFVARYCRGDAEDPTTESLDSVQPRR